MVGEMEISTRYGCPCQTGAQSGLLRYILGLADSCNASDCWAMLTSGGHELVLSLDLPVSPIPSTGFPALPWVQRPHKLSPWVGEAQVSQTSPSSRLLRHLELPTPESSSSGAVLGILSKEDLQSNRLKILGLSQS